MPPELTYPSLRCILEYLEPNKRIHIVSRSVVLRQCDKSIPVHMAQLSIQCDQISINDVVYKLTTRKECISQNDPRYTSLSNYKKLTPGDIPIGFPMDKWKFKFVDMEFKINQLAESVSKPCNLKFSVASKRMAEVLLGYRHIFADELSFWLLSSMILRLPKDFQVCSRNIHFGANFDRLIPLINASSFPLREIYLRTNEKEIMNHMVVITAGKLNVGGLMNDFPLEKFGNKHVVFKSPGNRVQIMRLIKSWVKDTRDVGCSFTLARHDEWLDVFDEIQILTEIKEEIGGEMKNLMVTINRSHQPVHCVSIPIDISSELNICILPNGLKIKIEMMPLSTATDYQPLHEFDLFTSATHSVEPDREHIKMWSFREVCGFIVFWLLVFAVKDIKERYESK